MAGENTSTRIKPECQVVQRSLQCACFNERHVLVVTKRLVPINDGSLATLELPHYGPQRQPARATHVASRLSKNVLRFFRHAGRNSCPPNDEFGGRTCLFSDWSERLSGIPIDLICPVRKTMFSRPLQGLAFSECRLA